VAAIPVLQVQAHYVVYSPLATTPLPPDVVILFVNVNQTLILAEATQQVENRKRLRITGTGQVSEQIKALCFASAACRPWAVAVRGGSRTVKA
jgi:uncharacterized protein (DUF169 family)